MTSAWWVIRVGPGVAVPRVPSEMDDAAQRIRDTVSAIAALNADPHSRVGDLKRIAGDVAPPGWIFCDGSTLSRRDFSALFEVIGEKWGAGDGLKTFRIPSQADLEAPIGVPPGQIVSGGSVDPVTPPPPPSADTPGPGAGGSAPGGRPRDPRDPLSDGLINEV